MDLIRIYNSITSLIEWAAVCLVCGRQVGCVQCIREPYVLVV